MIGTSLSVEDREMMIGWRWVVCRFEAVTLPEYVDMEPEQPMMFPDASIATAAFQRMVRLSSFLQICHIFDVLRFHDTHRSFVQFAPHGRWG